MPVISWVVIIIAIIVIIWALSARKKRQKQ